LARYWSIDIMRLAIVFSLAVFTLANTAHAQPIAENMTCSQAISYFANNGVIYKIAHGKNILPIRVGVPVAYRHRLRCQFDERATPYWVPTVDTRRCVISYHCTPSGRY
jgi:hypothetical protein